jgi:hypothetical protein
MQNENAMNPQSGRSNNLVVLRVQLGNPKKNDHFNVALMEKYKIYHKKEGGGFLPSPRCGEFCEFKLAHDLFVHYFGSKM